MANHLFLSLTIMAVAILVAPFLEGLVGRMKGALPHFFGGVAMACAVPYALAPLGVWASPLLVAAAAVAGVHVMRPALLNGLPEGQAADINAAVRFALCVGSVFGAALLASAVAVTAPALVGTPPATDMQTAKFTFAFGLTVALLAGAHGRDIAGASATR